jgi:hypothetical protein
MAQSWPKRRFQHLRSHAMRLEKNPKEALQES